MRTILFALLLPSLLVAACGAVPVGPAAGPLLPRPPGVPASLPTPPASPSGGAFALWQDAPIFTAVHRILDAVGAGASVRVEMYEFERSDLAAAPLRARA